MSQFMQNPEKAEFEARLQKALQTKPPLRLAHDDLMRLQGVHARAIASANDGLYREAAKTQLIKIREDLALAEAKYADQLERSGLLNAPQPAALQGRGASGKKPFSGLVPAAEMTYADQLQTGRLGVAETFKRK